MVEEYGVYKGDVIEAVAKRTGKPKSEVKEVLESILDEMLFQLEAGQKVCLTGFGTFDTPYRKERIVSHPMGYTMVVPRTRRVRFRAGDWLKARVKR